MTDPTSAVLSSFSYAVADVVARSRHAIVSVHSHRSQASGFVWKPGLIVTADEALAEEGEVSVKLADGTARPASIAGRDHTTDIALLRFDAKDDTKDIAPAVLSSVVPDLGSLSVVVAAEHGVATAALGAVSLVGSRWRSLRGGEIDARIELDVRLRPRHEGGLVLNPLTAESQVYGGVIGSLNFALFEDRILDRNTGQMVNPNMEWYLLAGMSDIPQIDVRLKNMPERGVIGLGEPPTVPTAAAVALAVRNAIGVSVRSLPLTPMKILQSLQQKA